MTCRDLPLPTVDLEVRCEIGHAHGPLLLAAVRHGALFGAEGLLLALPAMYTTRVVYAAPAASVLVISGAGLAQLRASQPLLLQRLLAATFSQQQDYTHMLARRTARWVGGGWAGPNFEHSVAPRPDELDSLPQGFGRAQVAGLPRERELASRLAEEAGVGASHHGGSSWGRRDSRECDPAGSMGGGATMAARAAGGLAPSSFSSSSGLAGGGLARGASSSTSPARSSSATRLTEPRLPEP